MAKNGSSFGSMLLALFVVTLISSAALGFVYKLTKEPIEKAKELKKNLAIQRVMPEFNNQPSKDMVKIPINGDTLDVYVAKYDNVEVGYAIETFSNEAFGGSLKLLAGFLPDGTINNVAVLEHKETPGLGDKISKSKSDWSEQFNGKNPEEFELEVKKNGGDVDAITASTITSRAYCDAIDRAYKAYKKGGKQ